MTGKQTVDTSDNGFLHTAAANVKLRHRFLTRCFEKRLLSLYNDCTTKLHGGNVSFLLSCYIQCIFAKPDYREPLAIIYMFKIFV